MNDSKLIAVIILNWNGERLLKEYLPSVVEYSDNKISDIIVVDNGSTDGSIAMLEKNFPTVGVMRFDRNYGFAAGYNKALAEVDNKYVVLLNSDVAVTPGWDVELLAYMEQHPQTAACQPKILSYNRPEYFEYAGACGDFLTRMVIHIAAGEFLGRVRRIQANMMFRSIWHGQVEPPLWYVVRYILVAEDSILIFLPIWKK